MSTILARLFAWRAFSLAGVLGLLAGCASLKEGGYPSLSEAMDTAEVQGLWGEPTAVQEYDDSEGHHLRWEYHRSAVGEQRYWSLELQQTGRYGFSTTAVRRGRPYTQKYLAAWVVFIEGKVGRWQTYGPPTEEPVWLRSARGLQSRSSELTYP